jgi:hypothetical protein
MDNDNRYHQRKRKMAIILILLLTIQLILYINSTHTIFPLKYSSDNEASRIIAWHLVNDWYNDPKFVSDFEKLKLNGN